MSASWEIRQGDVLDRLREMPAESIDCCITSPPYFGLRDYGLPATAWGDGWVGCLGLEPTAEMFVAHLVEVFAGVHRVLRDDATLWLNLGDSYAGGGNGARDPERWPKQSRNNAGQRSVHAKKNTGCKPKDLLGIPWMAAFALRDGGWYLRSDIIWAKPNPMPESVADRPTSAHEHVFLLSKSGSYFYDADAIREVDGGAASGNGFDRLEHRISGGLGVGGTPESWQPGLGRNKRNVWTVPPKPYPDAHYATFPPKLIEPMVLAGCPAGGMVLDPFAGTGTTLQVAVQRGRSAIGIELSPDSVALAEKRMAGVTAPLFADEPGR